MDEIYENDDHNSNNRQSSHNCKGHRPSHQKGNYSSTHKHREKVEHAPYFLPRCFLVGQGVGVELLR